MDCSNVRRYAAYIRQATRRLVKAMDGADSRAMRLQIGVIEGHLGRITAEIESPPVPTQSTVGD